MTLSYLAQLAKDVDEDVRRCVAESETHLPDDILMLLACDETWAVRKGIASRSQRLPFDVLMLLAADKDYRVVKTIAERKRLPAKVLDILSKRSAVGVREIVAKHTYRWWHL